MKTTTYPHAHIRITTVNRVKTGKGYKIPRNRIPHIIARLEGIDLSTVILSDGTVLKNICAYVPPEDVQRAKELKLNRNDIFREAIKKAIEQKEAEVALNPDKTRPQQHPQSNETNGGMVQVDIGK